MENFNKQDQKKGDAFLEEFLDFISLDEIYQSRFMFEIQPQNLKNSNMDEKKQ